MGSLALFAFAGLALLARKELSTDRCDSSLGSTAIKPTASTKFAAIPAGFRFNKVVAVVAFDRFEYFRQVIAALRRAWGSKDYLVTIAIDGAPQDEAEFSRQHDGLLFDHKGWESIITYSQELQWMAHNGHGFGNVVINISDANLGVWANKKRAVDYALALSDFVVILEDDIVMERDALQWFEWHVTSGLIFAHPEISTASCWSTVSPYDQSATEGHDLVAARELGLLDKYFTNSWAHGWGWATWRRTWDALGANWTGQDANLVDLVVAQGWIETMPAVARCNNIGAMGMHKRGVFWEPGHIHQRVITSGDFPNLEHCVYRYLPFNYTWLQLINNNWVTSYQFANASLLELRSLIQSYVTQQPDHSLWQSTC